MIAYLGQSGKEEDEAEGVVEVANGVHKGRIPLPHNVVQRVMRLRGELPMVAGGGKRAQEIGMSKQLRRRGGESSPTVRRTHIHGHAGRTLDRSRRSRPV